MAGNYPDVPSWRLAYDRDGTQAYILNSTTTEVVSTPTPQHVSRWNSEHGATSGASNILPNQWLCLIFPQLMDIDGIYMGFRFLQNTPVVQVSDDTTNGIDGAWTSIFPTWNQNSKLVMRTGIASTTVLAVRAIRIQVYAVGGGGTNTLENLHLYGEIAPGENPHRLSIVKAGSDVHVDPAEFDWGNVPRSSTADKTFRVKNLSPSLTAKSVRVATEAITDATPSVPGQHVLSYDGGSFLAQVNLGDLSPGAISDVITIRRVTPSNAELSLWWLRVFAEADSWE